MEEKKYKYLILTLNKDEVSLLEEINQVAMDDFRCDGVEEFSLEEFQVDNILGDRAYSGGDIPEELLDEVNDEVKSSNFSKYRYFFYEGDIEGNINAFEKFLKDNQEEYDFEYQIKEGNWEDWNTSWRKHYDIVEISKQMKIVPEWDKEKYQDSDHENIYIYPGMGFGTGEHETTNLCLKLFDNIKSDIINNEFCLDFGCGSGILGIGAIKFSNLKTTFCDIDSSALDNCVQNLHLNFKDKDLSDHRLVIRDRFRENENKYGLIFANILEHVLVLEKELLINTLSSNGTLIVSGILNNQVENIIKEYSGFLKKEEVISSGDWSAILFKKIV